LPEVARPKRIEALPSAKKLLDREKKCMNGLARQQ
jgi:hypothetical protein